MRSFIQCHQDKIKGVLSGLDRIRFRGRGRGRGKKQLRWHPPAP